jgi:aminoglycoside phosphotransferase (APT) family kinase protein
MIALDKDLPSEEWIGDIRRRYRCEAEIDRILTRKLRRRAGPGYHAVTLEQLSSGVVKLLKSELSEPFEISDISWLSGGASKVQMLFKLTRQRSDGPLAEWMVLRMEPSESVVETSRLREFQLMNAFKGLIPVPSVHWIDTEGEFLPYPAMICGFSSGVTKPSSGTSRVSGMGINFGVDQRASIGQQFIDHLSIVHTQDFRTMDLSAFEIPLAGVNAAEWQLNWFERVWEEDCGQAVPLMQLAAHWMRSHLPVTDRLSVVHADFRSGNFLYTEEDGRISAWLDWELGHIGDRHEDLAWIANSAFGHLAEDGKTFLVSGLMSLPELFAAYEKASGLPVIPETFKFYQIFNAYKCVVIDAATCFRVARGGKSHQDILVAWLSGLAPMVMGELRSLLEEVC